VERCATELELPYQWPQPFPFNSIMAARIFYVLQTGDHPEHAEQWAEAVFRASFGRGRDCSDPAVLTALADELEVRGDSLIESSHRDEIKTLLKEVTTEAGNRGVFGSPTLFFDGEMYWGADRIDMIERKLAKASKPGRKG
jgi:2-hydroxychromene-2-carboxylate isomerase